MGEKMNKYLLNITCEIVQETSYDDSYRDNVLYHDPYYKNLNYDLIPVEELNVAQRNGTEINEWLEDYMKSVLDRFNYDTDFDETIEVIGYIDNGIEFIVGEWD